MAESDSTEGSSVWPKLLLWGAIIIAGFVYLSSINDKALQDESGQSIAESADTPPATVQAGAASTQPAVVPERSAPPPAHALPERQSAPIAVEPPAATTDTPDTTSAEPPVTEDARPPAQADSPMPAAETAPAARSAALGERAEDASAPPPAPSATAAISAQMPTAPPPPMLPAAVSEPAPSAAFPPPGVGIPDVGVQEAPAVTTPASLSPDAPTAPVVPAPRPESRSNDQGGVAESVSAGTLETALRVSPAPESPTGPVPPPAASLPAAPTTSALRDLLPPEPTAESIEREHARTMAGYRAMQMRRREQMRQYWEYMRGQHAPYGDYPGYAPDYYRGW